MGWLVSLDLLGPPHSITFKGSETLQTKTGVFLTLIYLACYVFACVTFIRDYFDTSNPSIANKEVNSPADSKVNLAHAAILPIFIIWGHKKNGFLDAEEAQTKITLAAGQRDTNYGVEGGFGGNMTRYLAVPCRELEQEGKFNYPALAANYKQIKEVLDRKSVV